MTFDDLAALLRSRVTVDTDPLDAFAVVVALFRDVRVDGVPTADGHDMLLFQFGTFNWGDGTGTRFELDLTRQCIPDDPDAEEIVLDTPLLQLSCTFRYDPAVFDDVGGTDRWFRIDEVDAVLPWLKASKAVALARSQRAVELRIRAEDAE